MSPCAAVQWPDCNPIGGIAVNDLLLRDDVLYELAYEPSLDASNITVQAKGGIVTLSGRVARYADRLIAERVAWRVSGVKAIALDIE
jgi:osmotically-inducible protein OsmY